MFGMAPRAPFVQLQPGVKASVTRTRAGGQTYKYTYATPTQRDVDHLVNVTAKMRDHVLRHGRF